MLLNKRVVHEECYNRVFYVGILVILNCELFFRENHEIASAKELRNERKLHLQQATRVSSL